MKTKSKGKTNRNVGVVYGILKDRKPHDLKSLAKAIKRPRCLNSIKALRKKGCKIEVKDGHARLVKGELKTK